MADPNLIRYVPPTRVVLAGLVVAAVAGVVVEAAFIALWARLRGERWL